MQRMIVILLVLGIGAGAFLYLDKPVQPAERRTLNEQEQAVEAYYLAVETGDVQKTIDASRGMVDGRETAHALQVKEDADRFGKHDGIHWVNARCSEPRKLDLPKETWLSSCEVLLHMNDGGTLDQGISRVSKIDGEWKFVL